MIVHTHISHGFAELLETFFKANDLVVEIRVRVETYPSRDMVDLVYEDDSDTAINISFMSMKHLGFENMLCDFLIRCGIDRTKIAYGRMNVARDMNQVEREWQEKRKELGFR